MPDMGASSGLDDLLVTAGDSVNGGDSGISTMLQNKLLNASTDIMPVRDEVLKKRQILDDAMQRLSASQRYDPSTLGLSQNQIEAAYTAKAMHRGDGAWGSWLTGPLEAREAERGGGIDSYKTQAEAAKFGTGFDDTDMDNSIKLMGLADKAGDKYQMIKNSDGSWSAVNKATLQQIPLANAAGGGSAESIAPGSIPAGTVAPIVDTSSNSYHSATPTAKLRQDMTWDKDMEEAQKNSMVAQKAVADLNRFEEVNSHQRTGGATGALSGILGYVDPDIAELKSLNKDLAFSPGERPTGMRLTQGEIFLMREARPGTDKPEEANRAIAEADKLARQVPIDWNKFLIDFRANNGGIVDKAKALQMFNKYLDDNPVFPKDVNPNASGDTLMKQWAKSGYKVNPERKSLEEYAKSGGFDNFFPNKKKAAVSTDGSPKKKHLVYNPSTGRLE